ncbi:hypothetical protein B0H19DRAFT_385046 [Mycena capillaripes]|nr:hypothetical protein B0H19DRAFT_385046 [Mycena capillaripes]
MTTLTFVDKKLVDSPLVGPDGAVYYTTTTTHGFRGRKITTIMAGSGLVGAINWRDKTFTINGVQRKWSDLRSGHFSAWPARKWTWGNGTYKFQWHHMQKELVATSEYGGDAVRFTTYEPHLFHKNSQATIHFPDNTQDEIERMFLLMAVLQTEMHKQDVSKSAEAADVATSALS